MAASECESLGRLPRPGAGEEEGGGRGPVGCVPPCSYSLLDVSVGRRVISVAHREFGIVRSVSQAPIAQDLTISVIGSAYE